MVQRAYNNAKIILTKHNKELHALAIALLEHETLTNAQILNLLTQLKNQQQQQQLVMVAAAQTATTPTAPSLPSAAAATAAAAKAKGVAQPVVES